MIGPPNEVYLFHELPIDAAPPPTKALVLLFFIPRLFSNKCLTISYVDT